jgi:hypothetical protein
MWLEESHSSHKIRVTAQNTLTGERKGFTDWEALTKYLQTAIANHNQELQ